jgi:hypothetical protein
LDQEQLDTRDIRREGAVTMCRPKQLVGAERRERVSHQTWCGEG